MNVKAMAAIALTLIVAVPIGLGYILNIDDVERNTWQENTPKDITNLINNSSQNVYVPYVGVDNNNFASDGDSIQSLDFVSVGSTVSSIPVYSPSGTYSWSVTSGANYPAADFGPTWSFTVSTEQMNTTSFTMLNGTIRGVSVAPAAPAYSYTVTKTVDTYIVSDTEIPANEVTEVRFIFNGSYTIPVTTQVVSGYANPSYGWHAPDAVGSWSDYFWSNGFNNRELDMTVNLAVPSTVSIAINNPNQFNTGTSIFELEKQAGGAVIISTYLKETEVLPVLLDSVNLGNYQFIHVNIDAADSELTVSGLASWPSMTGSPALFNTTILKLPNRATPGIPSASRLYITDPTDANVYRIDRALISAGTYPTANDVTIDPVIYYPQIDSLKLTISKVGIVGDSITFAGVDYPVSNGQITIGSSKFNVDGLTFRSVTEDGVTWHNYIDRRQVGDTAAISPVGLGGTWSAIYTLSDLDLRTVTAPEWIPGGFGFDQDTFALIGLMTCAALTVILGMYGVRSGVKVMWLMMATGGAALVFLFML